MRAGERPATKEAENVGARVVGLSVQARGCKGLTRFRTKEERTSRKSQGCCRVQRAILEGDAGTRGDRHKCTSFKR